MFVWNTSGYEGAVVRQLVRDGFDGVPSGGLLVWVRRGREALSAMSYDHLPELPDHFPPLVGARDCAILRVGPQRRFPCSGRYPGLRGAPGYLVRCWHEAVLVLAAHEAGHIDAFRSHRSAIRQLARGKAVRVSRDSELACERRAVTALRRFRREHRCVTRGR
jgi:hypothetical protein